MKMLTIGELARLAGISAVNIRFYEKNGLLPKPTRSTGGHRLYPENMSARLRFIQNAKLVGFDLEEIKNLLAVQHSRHGTSKQIRDNTVAKLKVIQEKINALQKMAQILEHLTAACDGKMSIEACPILAGIYSDLSNISENKTKRSK